MITGLNGSGKTHFLKFLDENFGTIEIDGETIKQEEIAFFDYQNFKLKNEKLVRADFIKQQKQEILTALNNYSNSTPFSILNEINGLRSYLKVTDNFFIIRKLLSLTAEEIESLPEEIQNISPDELHQIKQLLEWFKNDVNTNEIKNTVNSLKQTQPILQDYFPDRENLWDITQQDIYVAIKNLKDPNFLDKGFGEIFKNVIEARERFQNESNEDLTKKQIKENFQIKYGKFPWIFVNDILKSFRAGSFNFNYEIEEPKEISSDDFQLKFKNTKVEKDIDIENFSSGEKVLLTLSLFLLKAEQKALPKLLLLDEIDATLHPSMCKNLVTALKENVIEKGTKIIFATHNPSTVAFCDEETDGIFVMENSEKIEAQPKDKAIEILSDGFISLDKEQAILSIDNALSKTDSPVLFTEGITDKIILETAWENYILMNQYLC